MSKLHNDKIIRIAYAANDSYIIPLCSSIKSVIGNTKEKPEFYILYSNLSKKNKKIISNIFGSYNINFCFVNNKIFDKINISDQNGWTKEILYRLSLADMLKDIDKILYLDCDTIALDDIQKLYNFTIDKYYAAVVEDRYSNEHTTRLNQENYFNSGVLLLNLQKLREDNLYAKMLDYANENYDKLICPDQDILNAILSPNIIYINKEWNMQLSDREPTDELVINNAKIIHFAGIIKPWNIDYLSFEKKYFFKYFNQLPLIFGLLNFYIPMFFKILQCKRKSIIWYRKSSKELILFNKYNIKVK